MPDPADRGREIARLIASLTDQFVEELRRILRATDGDLRDLLTAEGIGRALTASRVLQIRVQIRRILEQAGYDALAVTSVEEAARAYARSFLDAGVRAEAAQLLASAAPRLQAMATMAQQDLLGLGDELSRQLWQSVTQATLTARPVSTILADLESATDLGRARIATLFDTLSSMLARATETAGADDLPPDQKFVYEGPLDAKTRDFCAELVGQELTREQIDALDNQQLPNPFLTGGGWNCRHSWIAISR
jgi:hypothetical protein